MSRPVVFMFGGQSSRDDQMFDRLCAVDPDIGGRARSRASVVASNFDSNLAIQVQVTAVTLGWLELADAAGLRCVASAGLSLGEYTHIVDIGALTADETMRLVQARGRAYDAGPAGSMAAIYPASWDELAPLVEQVTISHGLVAPAVFNSPSQTVVGGEHAAVAALIELADEELYAAATVVEDRIAMHTACFARVAQKFSEVLEATPFRPADRAYWPNVLGAPLQAKPETFREQLTAHVHQPVRWRQTIDALVEAHPDAVFIEVGPRTVLRNLMRRRWHPNVPVFALDPVDAVDPAATLTATLDEIADVR